MWGYFFNCVESVSYFQVMSQLFPRMCQSPVFMSQKAILMLFSYQEFFLGGVIFFIYVAAVTHFQDMANFLPRIGQSPLCRSPKAIMLSFSKPKLDKTRGLKVDTGISESVLVTRN